MITPLDVQDAIPSITAGGNDPLLSRLITRTDRLIARHCGWPATTTGIYTMESASYIVYPQPRYLDPRALDHGLVNVASITSAYVDLNWEYGSTTQVASGSMLIDNEERVVWLVPTATESWESSPRANKLTVVAGFTTTPDAEGRSSAPPDLVHLAAMVVRSLWDRGQSEGIISSNVAGHSVTRDTADIQALPKAVRTALAPYVRWETRAS